MQDKAMISTSISLILRLTESISGGLQWLGEANSVGPTGWYSFKIAADGNRAGCAGSAGVLGSRGEAEAASPLNPAPPPVPNRHFPATLFVYGDKSAVENAIDRMRDQHLGPWGPCG